MITLNPIVYSEVVVSRFFCCQRVNPFPDPRQHTVMRRLLHTERFRHTPFMMKPPISVSRCDHEGGAVAKPISQKIMHARSPDHSIECHGRCPP